MLAAHPLLWTCVLVVLLIAVLLWNERRKDDIATRLHGPPPRIWSCIRAQGGGTVHTPKPMTQEQAMEYAGRLGEIMWVDEEHGFIFYRSRGH